MLKLRSDVQSFPTGTGIAPSPALCNVWKKSTVFVIVFLLCSIIKPDFAECQEGEGKIICNEKGNFKFRMPKRTVEFKILFFGGVYLHYIYWNLHHFMLK